MRLAAGVRGFAAQAGDLALALRVHGGKTALGRVFDKGGAVMGRFSSGGVKGALNTALLKETTRAKRVSSVRLIL